MEIPKRVEILKRKATSLFNKDDRSTIFDAVGCVHDIVTRTTLLTKAYYLHILESEDRTIIINAEFLDICFAIIKCKTKKVEQNKTSNEDQASTSAAPSHTHKEDVSLFTKLKAFHDTHFSPFEWALEKKQLSIDFILGYSNKQLITCYENNINANYESYVRRYVLYSTCVRKHVTCAKGIDKIVKSQAWMVSQYLLYDMSNSLIDLDDQSLLAMKHKLCVPRPKKSILDAHMNKNFPLYLDKMVRINRYLELEFNMLDNKRPLFSPLILSKSFIPSHIRIDTNALAQLLMTQDRIKLFVDDYELQYGVRLKMKNKADLGSSYETLTGDTTASDYTKAMHATKIWAFICNLDNAKYAAIVEHTRKNGEAWVFDNMIVTDGYSASFQISPKVGFRRSKFGFAKRRTNAEKKAAITGEFVHVKDHMYDAKSKYVSADPGKGCLVKLSDGLKTMSYTKAQRDVATLKSPRQEQLLRVRKKYKVPGFFESWKDDIIVDPSVHDYECNIMSQHSFKSCILSTFLEYVAHRAAVSTVSKQVYRRPIFRQHKFLVHSKIKSTDTRFVNSIAPFFTSGTNPKTPQWMLHTDDALIQDKIIPNFTTTSIPTQNVIILMGDWGRNPNLRGSASTPGVGLRRKINRKVPTLTTPEHYTSKTCPCCRGISLTNPTLPSLHSKQEHVCETKHHLLRCTNVCKSSWWNRDVAGAFNILYKGLQMMRSS